MKPAHDFLSAIIKFWSFVTRTVETVDCPFEAKPLSHAIKTMVRRCRASVIKPHVCPAIWPEIIVCILTPFSRSCAEFTRNRRVTRRKWSGTSPVVDLNRHTAGAAFIPAKKKVRRFPTRDSFTCRPPKKRLPGTIWLQGEAWTSTRAREPGKSI